MTPGVRVRFHGKFLKNTGQQLGRDASAVFTVNPRSTDAMFAAKPDAMQQLLLTMKRGEPQIKTAASSTDATRYDVVIRVTFDNLLHFKLMDDPIVYFEIIHGTF